MAALERFPANLSCDEGDNLREIYQILRTGKPGFFELDWKPQPAFSQHLTAWSVALFGDSPDPYLEALDAAKTMPEKQAVLKRWREDLADLDDVFAMRLPSAIFSVLAIAFFYALARRTLPRPAATAAAFLLALNPMYLNFSRSGWENVHICLATFLAVWGVVRLVERRGAWWVNVPVAAVGGAWGLYGYFSGRAVGLVLAVGVAMLFILAPPRERPMSPRCRLVAGVQWLLFWFLLAGPVLVAFPMYLTTSQAMPHWWWALSAVAILAAWALTLSWYRRLALDLWGGRADGRRLGRLALRLAAVAVLSLALFVPQLPTIAKHWQRFTMRMRTVSSLHVEMPADNFDKRVDMIRHNTWMSLQAPLRPINNRLRYAPGQEPLLHPALGFLMLVGMLVSLPRFGRHAWWWLMLVVPFFVTQVMTRGTPDGARGIAIIPVLYYFAGLGMLRFRALWYGSRRRTVPVLLILFALLAAWAQTALYLEWTGSEHTLGQRSPDVRIDEFPEWSQWQIIHLHRNRGTRNIGEWRHLRQNTPAIDLVRRALAAGQDARATHLAAARGEAWRRP